MALSLLIMVVTNWSDFTWLQSVLLFLCGRFSPICFSYLPCSLQATDVTESFYKR